MSHSVEEHFAGRSDAVCQIYNAIVAAASQFGPVEEDPKKTSIHLNRKTAFAGIQTRREFLIPTVKATDNIDSGRISKRQQTSPNRWHHEIKIANVGEVDAQIVDWLRAAYGLSA